MINRKITSYPRKIMIAIKKEILLFPVILIISGCAMNPVVSMVADKTYDYDTERATIFMKNPPPDILNTAAAVGESMGYHLNSQITGHYSDRVIQLESKTGQMSYMVTAHKKENTIQVMRTPDGLQIEVRTVGTFGAGSEKNAKKILEEYKQKLMNRLALH